MGISGDQAANDCEGGVRPEMTRLNMAEVPDMRREGGGEAEYRNLATQFERNLAARLVLPGLLGKVASNPRLDDVLFM